MHPKINPQFCRANYRQPRPCGGNDVYSAREIYYRLRHEMRRRKRLAEKLGYRDMDVEWYASSLGIKPFDARVSRRTYWGGRELPAEILTRLVSYPCLVVFIPGPCAKLP